MNRFFGLCLIIAKAIHKMVVFIVKFKKLTVLKKCTRKDLYYFTLLWFNMSFKCFNIKCI